MTNRQKDRSGQSPERLERLIGGADLSPNPALPVAQASEKLLDAIRENQVVIVTGDTGSGKTTQIPKICLAAGRGMAGRIVCTQPRRIAAITVASRLSEEMGPAGPSLVGYRIRFRDRTGPLTRVQFVTDGLLIAELARDPRLLSYDTVIVDEAHERSLNIDVLLGVLRGLLPVRPDLKVIVTSATIDTDRFSHAFGGAPVISVGGKTFPVEIRYNPPGPDADLIDHLTAVVEEIRAHDPFGDMLVFLPSERHIREAMRAIKAAAREEAVVLPLFGRLSPADQQRIFKPAPFQKIVVATNVAETSITVPGIRYVVDSGLARISRFNPRTRTRSLPVSPISRASSDQRAGRAGRMSAGVCIRLYDEAEYLSREPFTQPEILRSSLAEVILRLVSSGIRRAEDFPFIDPPPEHSIREGYRTLQELGALDADGRLTRLGRLMARLPLDPRVSRMIIQARNENALKEVVIIASALSVQDPRERPTGMEARAEQAQRAFVGERSDFISYLRIWNVFENERVLGRTRSQMRRFCETFFLSYQRIMEWRDVADQIHCILAETGDFPLNTEPASPDSIHRSILAGFLGHIAIHKEGAQYQGAGGREVFIHPGSSLYKKKAKWIVSAELVRTSRLYARTSAEVKPEWIEEMAGDLARSEYSEPHWEKTRGEVMASERVRVFGLPVVERRRVSFGRIDPELSRDIFIREGLVPGELKTVPPLIRRNLDLASEIEEIGNRLRNHSAHLDETIIYSWYDKGLKRLEDESGRHPICDERTFLWALRRVKDPTFLAIDREKLLKDPFPASELELYPGHLAVSGHEIPLRYRFLPGDEEDGVTAVIPLSLLGALDPKPFEWLVPGLLSKKIEFLLKNLPKDTRKGFPSLDKTAESIAARLSGSGSLTVALEKLLVRDHGIERDRIRWPQPDSFPPYLLMRFEVVDGEGRITGKGRDLPALKRNLDASSKRSLADDPGWSELRRKWEVDGLTASTIPVLPPELSFVPRSGSGSHRVFTGYVISGKTLGTRLFLNRREAEDSSHMALSAFLAVEMGKELDRIRKMAVPKDVDPLICMLFGGRERLADNIVAAITKRLSGGWTGVPGRNEIVGRLAAVKRDLVARSLPVIEQIGTCINAVSRTLRILARIEEKLTGSVGQRTRNSVMETLRAEFSRLVPPDFPSSIHPDDLIHLPRYLKGLEIRAERAHTDPRKDSAKNERIRPYAERLDSLARNGGEETGAENSLRQLKRLMEEYRISVFAPELGAALPVSPKRIEEAMKDLA